MQRILKHIEFANSQDRLIIRDTVLNVFGRYEHKKGANESGGILLGYAYRDHTEIVRITTQSKFDRFEQRFFVRTRTGAQAEINKD